MRSMKVTAVAVVAAVTGIAQGGVLVLRDVPTQSDIVAQLNALTGNTVTDLVASVATGGVGALNLQQYDQVWDLRSFTALDVDDRSAYANYLGGGGRVFMTGEWHDGFLQTARNQSVEGLVDGLFTNSGDGIDLLGAGLPTPGNQGQKFQAVTAAATHPSVGFGARNVEFSNSEFVTSVGEGFYITTFSETGHPADGLGSVVGWDFGDLEQAANARMIAYFDLNIYTNPGFNEGAWIEDLWTFLDGSPQVVPLPSAAGLGLVGLTFLGARRRR